MSATYKLDGSIDLVDDSDADRAQTIAPGWTDASRDAAILAFFGPPKPPLQMDFLAFMALFTPSEQNAIVASGDTKVALFRLMAAGSGEIDLTDPRTIDGVNYLATAKLLTADRAAKVLSGTSPT